MNDRSAPIRLSAAPGGRGEVFTKLLQVPGLQIIQFSALACARHKSAELVSMQRRGRLSFLLLSEVDVVTGDYLNKIAQAVEEIVRSRGAAGVALLTGCQTALLSTDYRLLEQELSAQAGVPVRVHDGCRLCGMDEAGPDASGVDGLLYEFLSPAQTGGEPAVHLIGKRIPEEDSQVSAFLSRCGAPRLLRLAGCESWEDYQRLAQAKVNLLLSPAHRGIEEALERRLGISYVCLGGVYCPDELEADFQKLGRLLGAQPDVSSWREPVERRLAQVKKLVGRRPIFIDGDAELARWLLREGFQVAGLTTAFRQGLTRQQAQWFRENAPSLPIQNTGPGERGGGHGEVCGGHGGGYGQGRGGGAVGRRGGHEEHGQAGGRRGRPGGSPQPLGFAASLNALNRLAAAAGGERL
ncbi:MAG: hypothetical protein LUE91_01500 [Oscillospiraceae bacterium]|nr:hypothetical protein [Oscillospiraceae bacterium]